MTRTPRTTEEAIDSLLQEFGFAFVAVMEAGRRSHAETFEQAGIRDDLTRLLPEFLPSEPITADDPEVVKLKADFRARLEQPEAFQAVVTFFEITHALAERFGARAGFKTWQGCMLELVYAFAAERGRAVKRELAEAKVPDASSLRELADVYDRAADLEAQIGSPEVVVAALRRRCDRMRAAVEENALWSEIVDQADDEDVGRPTKAGTEFAGRTLRILRAGTKREPALELLAPLVCAFFEPELEPGRAPAILADRVRRWEVRQDRMRGTEESLP